MATNYEIDYNDPKFQQVEAGKQAALSEVNSTYNNMINQTDQYYQDQINAAKDYATTQQQLQQQNTDFTIEQINQQKDKAQKDYTKEQSGAYVDWQKQSGAYGVNAEAMAAQGLTNTGFSESSQVSMYNQYQNRVAMARETFNAAVLNYDNAIKDAQLQNNAKLAEIAYQALQMQLELSLEGFQYKNQLLVEQVNQQRQIDNEYHDRYLAVLNQMNTENALAEEVRQYNENLAFQREQLAEEIRQYEQSYALQMQQYNEQIRQFNAEMARLEKQDAEENAYKLKQLELQKQQVAQEQAQWEKEYQLKQSQLAEQQRQFDKEYKQKQQQITQQQKAQQQVQIKQEEPAKVTLSERAKARYNDAKSYIKEHNGSAQSKKYAASKIAEDSRISEKERAYILQQLGYNI